LRSRSAASPKNSASVRTKPSEVTESAAISGSVHDYRGCRRRSRPSCRSSPRNGRGGAWLKESQWAHDSSRIRQGLTWLQVPLAGRLSAASQLRVRLTEGRAAAERRGIGAGPSSRPRRGMRRGQDHVAGRVDARACALRLPNLAVILGTSIRPNLASSRSILEYHIPVGPGLGRRPDRLGPDAEVALEVAGGCRCPRGVGQPPRRTRSAESMRGSMSQRQVTAPSMAPRIRVR
jgi:hypothetical protein